MSAERTPRLVRQTKVCVTSSLCYRQQSDRTHPVIMFSIRKSVSSSVFAHCIWVVPWFSGLLKNDTDLIFCLTACMHDVRTGVHYLVLQSPEGDSSRDPEPAPNARLHILQLNVQQHVLSSIRHRTQTSPCSRTVPSTGPAAVMVRRQLL